MPYFREGTATSRSDERECREAVGADRRFELGRLGNLLGKRVGVSGDNKTSLYKYDDLNRLTDVYYVEDYTGSLSSPTYPSGDGNVHYTYVGGSRLRETMTDEHSVRPTRYEYDLQDRLLAYKPATPRTLGQDEESDTDVREIGYAYNNLGQKTQMMLTVDGVTNPPALEVNYLYYANGWLKEVKKGTSSIAAYTYDAVGNRDRVDLGNTTYTTYTYDDTNLDSRYLVDEIAHYDSSDALLNGDSITYDTRDAAGNPTLIKDWDDPTTGRAYSYDDNNRLASAAGTDYDYDWVGNKLRYPPTSPDAMTYDATDKLVLWPGEQSLTYYPTGSLYKQWNAAGTVTNKTWAYTGAELVSSVTHRDVTYDSEMAWDGDTNRVSFTSSENTGTWSFVYDTTAGIPAVVEENGGSPVYYVREPGGELIARIGASTQYYHFDELGSTRLITNGSGTVTDSYTYDAWGKQTAHTGSTAQPYRFVGQLGYYSHYQDTNLFNQSGYQFLQLGVRFYDAPAGRFTQMDPIKDGNNWYVYVSGLPTAAVDPTGLFGYVNPEYMMPCPVFQCVSCIKGARDQIDPLWRDWAKKNKKDVSKLKNGAWINAFMHCNSACWSVVKCTGKDDCQSVGIVEFTLNGPLEWINRSWKDRKMDIHNNNIGIGCGKKSKTKDDCMKCCWDDMKNWFVKGEQEPK